MTLAGLWDEMRCRFCLIPTCWDRHYRRRIWHRLLHVGRLKVLWWHGRYPHWWRVYKHENEVIFNVRNIEVAWRK